MTFTARDDLDVAEARIAELTKALDDLLDGVANACTSNSLYVPGLGEAQATGQAVLQGGYCRMTCRDGDDCGCPCHEEP